MPATEFLLAFLALGCAVGFLAGLLGVGGGGLAVPVLASLFIAMGMDRQQVVHLALGTSMAAMVVTSWSSFRSHRGNGNVRMPIAWAIAPGVILGTFAATFLAARLDARALAIFFAAFMGFVALQLFFGGTSVRPGERLLAKPLLFAGGLVIGAISALVSIGGGSLTVPFLNWQGVDIKKAIGTSAAVGFPIAIAGTLGYAINGAGHASADNPWVLGFVFLPAAVLIAAGSYFLAPYGARTAQRLEVKPLKRIFGVLVLLLSLRMAYGVMKG